MNEDTKKAIEAANAYSKWVDYVKGYGYIPEPKIELELYAIRKLLEEVVLHLDGEGSDEHPR